MKYRIAGWDVSKRRKWVNGPVATSIEKAINQWHDKHGDFWVGNLHLARKNGKEWVTASESECGLANPMMRKLVTKGAYSLKEGLI